MPDWDGITEFVAVVESGSFTAASRRLSVSVAQVSRQINALEKRLNCQLLYRTTRKISITEAGNLYYQDCRHLIDALEQAENSLTDLQSTPRGKLKVTAPLAFGEESIVPLINSFLKQHPQLQIEVVLTNRKLNLIDEGVDIAIRLGHLDNLDLRARQLSQRQSYTCASPDYLKQYGTPHSLNELQHHNCLQGTLEHWRFQENGREQVVEVSGSLRCNSGRALLDAALKGIGIVQLPDMYVGELLESGQMISVLPNFKPVKEGIWGLYPAGRSSSTKVQLLLDYLATNLK
ncbi:LysR family transcriptional regulator [Endozoicomonas sp. OPT23]|nr:LysR family transcriptional regulator [Endozoicomonas sp. OPT23]